MIEGLVDGEVVRVLIPPRGGGGGDFAMITSGGDQLSSALKYVKSPSLVKFTFSQSAAITRTHNQSTELIVGCNVVRQK